MKIRISAQAGLAFFVAVGLIISGLVSSPVAASVVAAHPVAAAPVRTALVDPYVYREHPTANHERVDFRPDRTDAIKDDHNLTFAILERAVSWARSPRCYTSQAGNDRGVYRYRIYEYETRNGDLVKTGRWVVVQSIIEWGDGHEDRGWLVTAYPQWTNSGAPATRNNKSWAPAWMTNSLAIGPVNNDIICN